MDEYQTEEEKKSQRIGNSPLDSVEVEDALMSRLEKEDRKTMHVATEDYYMAMTTLGGWG